MAKANGLSIVYMPLCGCIGPICCSLHTSTVLIVFSHDSFTELTKGFAIGSDNPVDIRPMNRKMFSDLVVIRATHISANLLQEERKSLSRDGRGILSCSNKVRCGGKLASRQQLQSFTRLETC